MPAFCVAQHPTHCLVGHLVGDCGQGGILIVMPGRLGALHLLGQRVDSGRLLVEPLGQGAGLDANVLNGGPRLLADNADEVALCDVEQCT